MRSPSIQISHVCGEAPLSVQFIETANEQQLDDQLCVKIKSGAITTLVVVPANGPAK